MGQRIGAALMICLASGAQGALAEEPDWSSARERMVQEQIEARGIEDARVLEALRQVPRHRFIPPAWRKLSYEDRAVPIGKNQTISQPYMVAVMTELLELEPGDRVLEVGTGSGYQAAVLSRLVKQVYSIEIIPELAERARQSLAELSYDNVIVVTGDGYRGLPEHAPFDAVIVTAAPSRVPQPLLDQLGNTARLVIPVGGGEQKLKLIERTQSGLETRTLFGVRFVPMTGQVEHEE